MEGATMRTVSLNLGAPGPSPAPENAFRDAIDNAVELMRRLDARFPR